jgi:hypothetical protein
MGTLISFGLLFFAGLILVQAGGLKVLRLRHYLVIGGCLAVWGCWLGAGLARPFLTPTTVRYSHELDAPGRLLYSDDILATLERGETTEHSLRFFDEKKLRLEILTPDGWAWREMSLSHDWESRELVRPVLVKAGSAEEITLWVDNRKGSRTVLACGQLEITIAANQTRKIGIPPSSQPGLLPLRIDGVEVDSLTGSYYLVDTSGQRAYRLKAHVYGGGLAQLGGAPPKVTAETLLSRRRLHPLKQSIDFFLTPAPSEIKVTTFGGVGAFAVEQRWELLEEP